DIRPLRSRQIIEHDADLGVQVDLDQRSDWLPSRVDRARIVALNAALLRGLGASNRVEHQDDDDRSYGLHRRLLAVQSHWNAKFGEAERGKEAGALPSWDLSVCLSGRGPFVTTRCTMAGTPAAALHLGLPRLGVVRRRVVVEPLSGRAIREHRGAPGGPLGAPSGYHSRK